MKIGQYSTREDAETALSEYNRKPYDIQQNNLTTEALFRVFIAEKSRNTRLSLLNQFKSAFNYFEPIWRKPFKNIEAIDIVSIINRCPKSASTKATIKNLHKHLEQYARVLGMKIEPVNDLVTFRAAKTAAERKIFTPEDVEKIKVCDLEFADSVKILLYSGIRVGELLTLRAELWSAG